MSTLSIYITRSILIFYTCFVVHDLGAQQNDLEIIRNRIYNQILDSYSGDNYNLNSKVFEYISDNQDCIFEREPLENLSKDGELMAYKHEGFWHPVDTLRDKNYLNEMFEKGNPPWL